MLESKKKPVYKIALGVEYNGTQYYGWQRQHKVQTIQEELEKALTTVANEPISVCCAGRTDAGVHSTGQVVHFETTSKRREMGWILGVNSNLPKDISVRWVKNVLNDFHARFSAIARHYRYIICNQRPRPALMDYGVTHFYKPLDERRMHKAAQSLLGENDFTSFRSANCQAISPWRRIIYVNVKRHREYVVVDIKANAFLHHMVRNIVGSLMAVGSGHRPAKWISILLEKRNRALAANTARAKGLYLVSVDYPDRFKLPKLDRSTFFSD